MANCYVKAYFDWIEQTAALQDAERGRLFIAILEYARSGLEPNLSGRESILFPVFKAQLDRDNKVSASRAASGKLGGEANGSKTKQNEANISKTPNKEKEEKKEKEKEKEYIPPVSPQTIPDDFSSELKSAASDWIAYKKERRETYKETGFNSLMSQIRNSAAKYGEDAVIELINQSIANSYQGITWDKLTKGGQSYGNNYSHGRGNNTKWNINYDNAGA